MINLCGGEFDLVSGGTSSIIETEMVTENHGQNNKLNEKNVGTVKSSNRVGAGTFLLAEYLRAQWSSNFQLRV